MGNKVLKVVVSGGGTGGHIFPAVAIADKIKERYPSAQIMFVGASGRMEMEKVPASGYDIIGLPIMGYQRGKIWANILLVPKLIISLIKAFLFISRFKPSVVIGTGGYASAPVLKIAAMRGIKTYIQEQNSYAGLTNRKLSATADKIFVAYPDMKRFFPADKVVYTGNPIRKGLDSIEELRSSSYKQFNLDSQKRTILIIGGSLGAKTLNEGVEAELDMISNRDDIQLIWQTGSYYYDDIVERLGSRFGSNMLVVKFISDMHRAYSIADLVISRAGASSVSELAVAGKPTILVPSPNVAEDHQTMNAEALSSKGAAIIITDDTIREKGEMLSVAVDTVLDDSKLLSLSGNIRSFAKVDAASDIVDNIFNT